MKQNMDDQASARCSSEYGRLVRVVLCPPRYMAIKEAINATQEEYLHENIDAVRALAQHSDFVQKLQELNVETVLLEPSAEFPEQVFTRDIGFTVGKTVFISEMAASVRQGEEKILERLLQQEGIPYQRLAGHRMEGGDIIVDGQTVFAGISSRTSEAAIAQLKEALPDYEVAPIHFDEQYLHLDTVFNILSEKDALIYPDALDAETLRFLSERYKLIRVSQDEQFALGANVLSVGNRRVFSLPQNENVNRKLRASGYEVIPVDFSEIIKSGGSFRCCTLPIVRE